MSLRVLLIDDDERLFELLGAALKLHDVQLTWAPDGRRGLATLEQQAVDAVLLDVQMPFLDGLEVLRRIRARSTVPVLMLTARGDEADRVAGLDLGADDYVAKPFSARELLARVRAVLRRTRTGMATEMLTIGPIALDCGARSVTVDGTEIDLTGIEFDVLRALMRHAGNVVPRESVLDEAGRGDIFVSDRTVDVHISHLRQKLGDDPKNPQWIKTVRGVGYVLARDPPPLTSSASHPA